MSRQYPEQGGPEQTEQIQDEQVQEEQRSFRERYKWHIRGAAAMLSFAAFAGCVNRVQNANNIDQELELSGGQGEITAVYPLDKQCYGGYDVDVKGVKSRISLEPSVLGLSIPFAKDLLWWSQEVEDMNVVNEVCTTGVDGVRKVERAEDGTFSVTVEFPKNAFEVTTYVEDPSNVKFKPDHGFGTLPVSLSEDVINALPFGLEAYASTNIEDRVRGIATTYALNTSAESCGDKAWPELAPLFGEMVIKDVVNDYQPLIPYNFTIKEQDVKVELPATVDLKNQYENEMAEVLKKREGVTVRLPGQGEVEVPFTCELREEFSNVQSGTVPAEGQQAR